MDYRHRARRRHASNEPGHAHELTFTCYRRFRFLPAERTCLWLAEATAKARETLDLDLWAYAFMPEHVHLLLRPRQPCYSMAAILKAIKEPVGSQAVAYLVTYAPHWLPRIARQRGRPPSDCSGNREEGSTSTSGNRKPWER